MSSPEYRERSAVLEFPRRAGFVAALDRRQLTICRKIASSPSPHAPLFCGEHRGSERLARYPRLTEKPCGWIAAVADAILAMKRCWRALIGPTPPPKVVLVHNIAA